MSVSSNEKSLRRRILFNSLEKGTPVDVVQRAIDLLENEYGDQPEIRYTELVKKLRSSFDHPAFKSGNLLGRIMMVRNKPADQIGPDPADTLPPSASMGQMAPSMSSPTQLTGLTGRDLVFNTMFSHINSSIAKRSPEGEKSYRENFLKEALNMNLERETAAQLVAWGKSSATTSSISGTDEDLHKIVNTAFVWLCGKFGPVDADKILLQAVNLAEQLPEAFDVSPRKFL